MFFKILPCVCFIRLGGENYVSIVKRGRWNKKFEKHCDRLCAVGYVGGKHLVSVGADNCILALFFVVTIACARERYL